MTVLEKSRFKGFSILDFTLPTLFLVFISILFYFSRNKTIYRFICFTSQFKSSAKVLQKHELFSFNCTTSMILSMICS